MFQSSTWSERHTQLRNTITMWASRPAILFINLQNCYQLSNEGQKQLYACKIIRSCMHTSLNLILQILVDMSSFFHQPPEPTYSANSSTTLEHPKQDILFQFSWNSWIQLELWNSRSSHLIDLYPPIHKPVSLIFKFLSGIIFKLFNPDKIHPLHHFCLCSHAALPTIFIHNSLFCICCLTAYYFPPNGNRLSPVQHLLANWYSLSCVRIYFLSTVKFKGKITICMVAKLTAYYVWLSL